MPAYWESAGLRIVKRAPLVALVLLLFTDFRSSFLMGQAKGPAPVFRPALEQIQSQTRIPILLPSKLPSAIPERDIKVASGEVRGDGYFISLYFSEDGGDAAFAARRWWFHAYLRSQRSAECTPGPTVGRSYWNVQACFVRRLLCTSKLMVGAERRDVPDSNKKSPQLASGIVPHRKSSVAASSAAR
jgi:hypothetical protein